jgi:ElaB/YqjD/DUF883 family membrane-anchored ribosome-binding protein
MTQAKEYPSNTGSIGTRANELAQDAGKEVLDAANRQGKKGMEAIGRGLEAAAQQIEGKSQTVEAEGLRKGADATAAGLRNASRYLTETDPQSMLSDLDEAIRAHPYRALAIGLGVGWLIGRMGRRD